MKEGKRVVNPEEERSGAIIFNDALFPAWLTVKRMSNGLKLRGVKRTELSAIADKYIGW